MDEKNLKRGNNRYLTYCLLLVLLVSSGFMVRSIFDYRNIVSKLENKQRLLINENKKLQDLIWTSEGVLKLFNSKVDVELLKQDLVEHPELIPYKGVLGGTMGFYQKDIKIMDNTWVVARFDDGHIGGKMLLEYHISDKDNIQSGR